MEASIQPPKIDDTCDVLSINGKHGVCRSYYHPDEFDIKVIEYANSLAQGGITDLSALDLGCSPYFPQSWRLAKLGFNVDAFDLENPIDTFDQINKSFKNRINYKVKDIATLKSSDLQPNYDIIYSNRCLPFLKYNQAYELIHMLVNQVKSKSRFFLSFFSESADYAANYPMDLPLENRFVPLNNIVARKNQMLAPVCIYKYDEIIKDLLGGLPITIIEILHAKSGSIKIIFEKK
jgi:hypothetical protein